MRLVLLTTFLLGTLFGCGLDRYTWNQRMTVTVETPEGVVSASSVIEVRAVFDENPNALSANREVYYAYTGEAVALEVRPGQWLFALMGDPAELMYRAAPERYSSRMRGEWLAEIPEQTEPVELVGELRPRMVSFGDITDPLSVTAVDPDDLAATFGEGFRLVSVTLEVTDAPVALGIVELLPWLPRIWPNQLDGSRFNSLYAENQVANSFSANSFSTEISEAASREN